MEHDVPHQPVPEAGGRKYRSRKQRPCDLCRTRKTQCRILNGSTACELCKRLSRSCTFILQPSKRDRPQPERAANAFGGQGSSRKPHEPEGSNDASQAGLMSAIDNGADNIGSSHSSLWLSPSLKDLQPYDYETMSHMVPMDWSSMEIPIDDGVDREIGPRQSEGRNSSHRPLAPRASSSVVAGVIESDNLINVENVSTARRSVQNVSIPENHSGQSSDWPFEFSLDSKTSHFNQLIGLSGEVDPFVLRHYQYDMHDMYPMFRLSFRRMLNDENLVAHAGGNRDWGEQASPGGYPPVQFVLTDKIICEDDLKATSEIFIGGATDEEDSNILKELIPIDMGTRLLDLYVRVIHPRFPVLSLADLEVEAELGFCQNIPVGTMAAVFALAMPFSYLDDELSVSKGYAQPEAAGLWAIAERSYQRSIHTPHLSSLQLCLLLLQRPPLVPAIVDAPSTWALSCSALAIAESLGLNLDSSQWRLPKNEHRMRKRLWWLTYVQHIWHALLQGRPSHIVDDNWDVSKLTTLDFDSADDFEQELQQNIDEQSLVYIALCDLTIIASNVLRDLYTLKAARASSSLESTLRQAQPLRALLEHWKQSLPFSASKFSSWEDDDLDLCAPLRLSYLTLEILIYRALLRPLPGPSSPLDSGSRDLPSSILDNSYICSQLGTRLISALKPRHVTTFWSPYHRYQLSYISNLILMNFAQSSTKEMADKNRALLNSYRSTLRAQARVWPLAKLAAMRLDVTFWKGLSAAMHGTGPDSPALASLGIHNLQPSEDVSSSP